MSSLNILVGEDDDLIGELLGELLVEMGHKVYPIQSTAAGVIESARRLVPDLMIVDLQLADGSGFDAADQIVRDLPIPYILVSGNILKLTKLKPAAIMLEKPYNKVGLALAIRRATEQEQRHTGLTVA